MNITNLIAESIVREHYQFTCSAQRLAGEADFNFLIITANGAKSLLKISDASVVQDEIDFQYSILNHLKSKRLSFCIPSILKTAKEEYAFVESVEGKQVTVRMHSWVEGTMLADLNPRTNDLFFSWGSTCGELSQALQDFDHPIAHRFYKWNPAESLHSEQYISFIDNPSEKQLAIYFWNLFRTIAKPKIALLRHSVNYSDAHEHNLLVNKDAKVPLVTGVIDFGDAVYGPTICELAIACAYAGMYKQNPIEAMFEVVRGYHTKFGLEEVELEVLFAMICGRLMITTSTAAYNLNQVPDNEYLQISKEPAWNLLHKLRKLNPDFVHFYFRSACHLEPHPSKPLFNSWLKSNVKAITSPIDLNHHKVVQMDLSVGSLDLGNNANFETIPAFEKRIDRILEEHQATVGIGGYGEIRPFYTTDAYEIEGNNGPEWRTMHLGMDYWVSDETEVRAFWKGEVVSIQNNDMPCDYGPTIILKHSMSEDRSFYSLYGHLSLASLEKVRVGQIIDTGEVIAYVGNSEVNGEWPPHLHFQVMLDMLGMSGDFPGVAFVSEASTWLSICPSIEQELNLKTDGPEQKMETLLHTRKNILGKSLSISYTKPLHIVRGYGAHLYDASGRRYLDTVNNVAHIGHEHPRLIKAATRQMELLNTNTRYINENLTEYANDLLSTFPESLSVVYFVNSGSEANELALRMSRAYSGQRDMVALASGYHGNTGGCVDISSYKFDGKGGSGAPEFTSVLRMPDLYRGEHRDPQTAGLMYAKDVDLAIKNIKAKGRKPAAFISESIMSCGGQIVLPPRYLEYVYEMIRKEGGLCIADEVQVGFGRIGMHFWGFEMHGVVPDIVTLGKPIGNGHPLGAVVTSKKVADAFTNGMEYFNTYGGNPVSCAIGKQVLNIIKEEGLQEHAMNIGNHLMDELNKLKHKFPIIGDVRGQGLFLGIELVENRISLTPAAKQAEYLADRMRENGILMSTDGPLNNVLKIKPPMCFSHENSNQLISRLAQILEEDFMQIEPS